MADNTLRDPRGTPETEVAGAIERIQHPDAAYHPDALLLADAVGTLRRDLTEAEARLRLLWDATGIERDAAVGFVAGAIRSMVDTARVARTQLRPQLARAEDDVAMLRQNCATETDLRRAAQRERDEAVAETERVRKVYREAKDRLRNALEVTAAIWDAEAERLIEVRDKSGDRAKRLRVEAAAHAYRACHHALLAVLTSPLDGAATTNPQTAPAPRQDDEQPRRREAPGPWQAADTTTTGDPT